MDRALGLIGPPAQFQHCFRLGRKSPRPVQQLRFSPTPGPNHSILANAPQTVPVLCAGASRQRKDVTRPITDADPVLGGSRGRTNGFDHLRPHLTFLPTFGSRGAGLGAVIIFEDTTRQSVLVAENEKLKAHNGSPEDQA